MYEQIEREYHLAREQQERRAAETAACPQAQRAHRELAAQHCAMARQYPDWRNESPLLATAMRA